MLFNNKKGYVPPLAFALLVLLLIIIVATAIPEVRATIISILSALK